MEEAELEPDLLRQAERREPALAEPLRVLSVRREGSGHTVYSVSAGRLVPVDDEDPSLRDVSVAVPVTGEVEVDRKGGLARVSLGSADANAVREARAFTRNLIANGAVRGLPSGGGPVRRGPGLGGRSTHEVHTDGAGRRVIRRAGFDITGRTA